MRLCIDARPVQNANRVRGIGVLIHNLLAEMGRQAVDDEVVLVTQQGEPFPPFFRRESRIQTFRPERPNRFNWLADHFLLPGVVRRSGAPVFLATDFNSYLAPQPGVRGVAMLYDLIPFLFPEAMAQQPLSIRVGWPVNFRKLGGADRIISISEATKNDAVRVFGIDPERVSVVYPGIDHSLFNEHNAGNADEQQRLRARYGLDGEFFLYVGDTDWRKNLNRVLLALAEVPGDSRLLLVGKRALVDRVLHARIKELGLEKRVVLTGYLPESELPPLYGAARALVFPSLYEGFGFPVAEAMACGCPVITSNVSSMPEVAGPAALLVNPESVEDIAAAMHRMNEDDSLRTRLKADGVSQAARFSWKESAGQVLDLVRSLQ